MRRFFEEHKLENEGLSELSENRVNKIKYSVLERVEEDKPMKKRRFIKPLLIAAAMIVTAAASSIVTLAAGNGQTTYSVVINGKNVPYKVEIVEEYIQYDAPWGETVPARKVEELITYEIPEEFVVEGGHRELTDVSGEIFAADTGNQLMVYSETRGHADKLPGVICKKWAGNYDWLTNTTSIEVEYVMTDYDIFFGYCDELSDKEPTE